MQATPSPAIPPKDLESLVAQAAHYAEWMMRTSGSVPPTLMAHTPEGFILFTPSRLDSEAAKDDFARTGRLIAIGYRAAAVVMILESWATFAARPGAPLPKGRPSQSPDRKEIVAVMGESRDGRAQQFLFIQRDAAGKFTGFGTSLLPQFDKLEGRFAGMIPPNAPTDEDTRKAQALLAAMGVTVFQAGFDPSWN